MEFYASKEILFDFLFYLRNYRQTQDHPIIDHHLHCTAVSAARAAGEKTGALQNVYCLHEVICTHLTEWARPDWPSTSWRILSLKNKNKNNTTGKEGCACSSVVQCLSIRHKTLALISSTVNKNKNRTTGKDTTFHLNLCLLCMFKTDLHLFYNPSFDCPVVRSCI
jgi:hypothetical protein